MTDNDKTTVELLKSIDNRLQNIETEITERLPNIEAATLVYVYADGDKDKELTYGNMFLSSQALKKKKPANLRKG